MDVFLTKRFRKDYSKLSSNIQKRTDAKLQLLSLSLSHPSLRIKKVKKCHDIFEETIADNYRFLFRIEADAYYIVRVGTHNILDKL